MRRLLIYLFTMSLLWNTIAAALQWEEVGSEHFIAYFIKDNKFAKAVLEKAEYYYRNTALDLGYPRYSEFWTWDKRVKIYIYPSHRSYLKASDMPSWSHGMADYTNKEILSYINAEDFLDSIIPHETAHLIFRDFVGFTGEIPLWLDEGVAQWAEEKKRKDMKAMAKKLYEADKLLLLDDLMRLDIRRLSELDRVYIRATRTKEGGDGVLFLSTDVLVHTYYLEAVSLIGFLIERYGSKSFADFCRELRDGKSVEKALKSAYSVHIDSIKKLEDKWRDYLAKM